MEKIKVAIIDSSSIIESVKGKIEKEPDMEFVGGFTNGQEAINKTKLIQPDVIVLDLLIPGVDGFDCITGIKASLPECKFIVTSNLNSSVFVSRAIELGVDYFMMKPVEEESLIKRIREIYINSKKQSSVNLKKLEEKITNIFLTVGIPAHIKGYQFLRDAIKMAVEDPHIINSITKRLYPGIAALYDTSASKVERAIRHAIEVAWNKGKIENINDVFGLKVYDTHEKPTNGEFIALVADKMLLEKY